MERGEEKKVRRRGIKMRTKEGRREGGGRRRKRRRDGGVT